MCEAGITCIVQELQLNQFEFQTYLKTADEILDSYPGLTVFSRPIRSPPPSRGRPLREE